MNTGCESHETHALCSSEVPAIRLGIVIQIIFVRAGRQGV